MNRNYILLTGATGFIGQYLLHDLLSMGKKLAVLVRAKDGYRGFERIEGILQDWESRLRIELPRPVCLEGDIRDELFGLDASDVHWLRDNVNGVLHNAAMVEFVSQGRTIWDTNVHGTENCLELCRAASIENLHYVSTAYVCGTRRGRILESQLDCGQEFHNEYERSKFKAEQIVRSSNIPKCLTVYRPSVVVGDSRTGFATSFRGFYVLAQFTHLVGQHARRDAEGRWHHPVRLDKSGHERRNFVPVDWVAHVMTEVVRQPHLHGETYHIAPTRPVSAAEIEAALRQYFDYYGVSLAEQNATTRGEATGIEQMFFAHMAKYMPYWDNDPEFDLTNTRAALSDRSDPDIDVAGLVRMIDFAVKNRFGRNRKRVPLLVE